MFETFEFEQSSNCQYDSLLLFSLDENGVRNPADDRKLCGQELPGILTFTESKVQVHFSSDAVDQFGGFKVRSKINILS
jgi:hypothetical protein